jgi:hypothetical protein
MFGLAMSLHAGETRLTVDARQVTHRISPYLTGACMEDVNHEVYGGIYSQMVFGESFGEPAPSPEVKGFTAWGGTWLPDQGILRAAAGDGSKLIAGDPVMADGEAAVDVMFPDARNGNAGLILKVSSPGTGADAFTGYEVSLDTRGQLILGRHRGNWEPLRSDPCEVPVGKWIRLAVSMTGAAMEISVDGRTITRFEDKEHPLGPGHVGLRTWQRDACFRNLVLTNNSAAVAVPFEAASNHPDQVSGQWRALRNGGVEGELSLQSERPFSGRQFQRIRHSGTSGEIGIHNQGLNRWGMNFVSNKPYEGRIWVRTETNAEIVVALESGDGSMVHAESTLLAEAGDWRPLDFTLTPTSSDARGRFAIRLGKPSTIDVGHAFLQPGDWGRFKGLPVRKDVAEGLITQGVTLLRFGGCAANAAEYRWKDMIGPRDRRPPYKGWWYPHTSNGWGIVDFMNFCEAAGIPAIPDFHMGESPQDMADFIEYANGPSDSTWGRKRAADGHPASYGLKYLQLGNEEKVNEDYWLKFKPMAEAIWAKDKDAILVVGDFAYQKPIADPYRFDGADSKITSLETHRKILQLAKQHQREVWFDVHIWTDGPLPTSSLDGALFYLDALEKLADGARFKVVVFELNANNHSQRRALANALAIQRIERDGRIPVVASANCLQPDGQNDNGWDQGLLFLKPEKVWLQPPGYVTRMISSHYQALSVRVESSTQVLDVVAKRSDDGKTLVIQVVNPGTAPQVAVLDLRNFTPSQPTADVEELAGPLDAANTGGRSDRLVPKQSSWEHGTGHGAPRRVFAPHSFTVIKFH